MYQGTINFTHRLAYAFTHNVPVESLEVVRHTCDNPGCCNPSHLINGTILENVQDRDMKGRGNQARGAQKVNAKLTEKDVLEIRKRYSNGEKQTMIAINYGVNHSHISGIVNKKKWAWLSR